MSLGPGAWPAPSAWRVVVPLAVILVTTTGCVAVGRSAGREVHGEGQGPLSASMGTGNSLSLHEVGETPWNGTFGSFQLCVDHGRDPVTIEGARAEVAFGLTDTTVVLRTVPPVEGQPSKVDYPYASIRGTPPRFSESYAPASKPAGSFSSQIAGVEITRDCKHDLPADGYQELMVSSTAHASGGRIKAVIIDYVVRGRHYSLRETGSWILCGNDPRIAHMCD